MERELDVVPMWFAEIVFIETKMMTNGQCDAIVNFCPLSLQSCWTSRKFQAMPKSLLRHLLKTYSSLVVLLERTAVSSMICKILTIYFT